MPTMPRIHKSEGQYDKELEGARKIRRSARWTRFSARLRKDNPLCQAPGHDGEIAPSSSVHHFQPLIIRPDLAFVEDNCWCLCTACHKQITDLERNKGIRAAQMALTII